MFEIIEPRRRIQLKEAAPHPLEEVGRKTFGAVALKDLPSLFALPTEDHGESLPYAACSETCYINQSICSAIRYMLNGWAWADFIVRLSVGRRGRRKNRAEGKPHRQIPEPPAYASYWS